MGPWKSFLVKYNAQNEYEWLKIIESATFFYELLDLKLKTDTKGNLIFAGDFSSSFSIDTTMFRAPGSGRQIIVGKIATDGTILWIKDFGNRASEECTDIEIGERDNIYIAGVLDEAIVFFDDIEVEAINHDPFFAKLDKDGNVKLVKSEQSEVFGNVKTITLSEGGVLLGGQYYSENTISPSDSTTTLPFIDKREIFTAIYSKRG